jgi:deoxyhypusine synthase
MEAAFSAETAEGLCVLRGLRSEKALNADVSGFLSCSSPVLAGAGRNVRNLLIMKGLVAWMVLTREGAQEAIRRNVLKTGRFRRGKQAPDN